MTCQRIKFGNGYAIICGRRGKMSQRERELIEEQIMLNEEQQHLVDRTRKSIAFHRELATKCDAANLPILAREHDYVARELEAKIGMQNRAFNDGALGAVEKTT